jgi:hypothetical protein
MIQPLRRDHLWIWICLSAVLFVLFTAGLLVRQPGTPLNPAVSWEKLK